MPRLFKQNNINAPEKFLFLKNPKTLLHSLLLFSYEPLCSVSVAECKG